MTVNETGVTDVGLVFGDGSPAVDVEQELSTAMLLRLAGRDP